MPKIEPHFVYNEKKKKTGAVLKSREFEQCLNSLEDYHDYLIINERSKKKEPLVPFEDVMKNLKKRAKKMTFVSNLRGYKIVFKKSAEKDLQKLPTRIAKDIEKKLSHMISGGENLNILKLVGYATPTHRLRAGDYRVIFEIHDKEIIVLVISIGHRKDAY